MRLQRFLLLPFAAVLLAGCAQDRARPGEDSGDCRCEGAVPEGTLRARCGETQCVGGVAGYLCTGANAAVAAPEACLAGDGGAPRTGEDAGPGSPDAGTPRPDAGPGVDAGCATTRYYRDADGDGYGDPEGSMEACSPPSGWVTNDDDCNDGDPGARPGATELCDGIDNDCDGTVAPCSGLAGSYAGTYQIYTAERLGSSVINEMRCTGTSSLAVDVTASPALSGTVSCTYGGGLSAFASTQSGTLEADLRPDGSVTGRVTHRFDPSDSGMTRTFSFTGTIAGATLGATGTGSWRPHPMSAVPWEVDVSLSATR